MLAVAVATVPVAGVFSLHRVFHVRDLCLFFWGRHIWFRRSLLSGEWPLWDPYMGAGQSAVADALNQMFLLPVLALRLIGSEIVGFNLWVALPFPIAALGAYVFLRWRFSAQASALGAIAFSVCGPVISTGNFPNLSWSVAAMPWVFWAADRVLAGGGMRAVAGLAVTLAFQALAGEPVSLTATGGLVLLYALWVGSGEGDRSMAVRFRGLAGVTAGLALGLMGAAIQLLPLSAAVRDSWRVYGAGKDFWALHPLALAEMVSPHLFGDYFTSSYFAVLPWMPPLNSGRDPFFFSIYFGTALIALAVFGAVAGWRRSWSGFWVTMSVVAVFAAFGPHTPFYPFVREHVPVVASFRFPVKYLLVVALALAALAASGWDALRGEERRTAAPRRYRCAQISGVVVAVILAGAAYVLSGACVYFPEAAGRAFLRLAAYVGVFDAVDGADYLLKTLPAAASRVMLFSLGAALFLGVASTRRREARFSQVTLFALIGVELVAAAWGINPTFDAVHYRQPDWITATRGNEQSRFYFGGKVDGTVDMRDLDAPQNFVRPFDMSPLDGRGALSVQTVFVPAAWRAREMLSYDLAVLWPRPFELVVSRFRQSDRATRDRFLWRSGVRYRIVPTRIGGSRPAVPIKYFNDLRLFDWGPVFPRVSVVPTATVVPDVREQVAQLFSPTFDPAHTVALTTPAQELWGRPGPPVEASARVVGESANEVTVEAGVPAAGGYLLMLDSFSPGWRVTVDGASGTLYRANALFRSVRLAPGRHIVHFRYLPESFVVGAAVSAVALIVVVLLLRVGRRRVM
jgi:hypothetical protein